MESLGAATTRFGFHLFKELSKVHKGNVVFSPVSISTAIGMLLLGARGATAAQLREVLVSEQDAESSGIKAEEKEIEKTEEIHHQFQMFLSEISKVTNNHELKIANRLFGEKTYLFLQAFKESCQKFYQAELQELAFADDTEECRRCINDWVTQKTEGKISEILAIGTVSPLTKLVLVNAIYFKGKWKKQFDRRYTRGMPFKVNQEKKTVQMMFKKDEFKVGYVEEVRSQVLELPYAGEELSMVILLPDEDTDLVAVEKALTPEKLTAWMDPEKMTSQKIQVFLPRFKLEQSYDLEPVLRSLGMTDAFEEAKADFSGMSTKKNVPVSKVAHKCFGEVNEEGTEAAAATAVVRNSRCIRTEPKFCADHPFLFFIRHHKTNSILFCGRFSSP
ncbi:serpin B8 isoform X2 [Phyllostomus discolor]|uniref:Leukocyte elastase inhibitor n=1 Tax=Phyllostomus discolor TaxID=89673 RepID=A0A7E6CIL7_9CHIR|nr:serpin B8 isoform X2 [Phyllostomus discolor]